MTISAGMHGGVHHVVIDRPALNALDLDEIEALEEAFLNHPEGAPLVLEGAGNVFSAGVDTKAFASYSGSDRLKLAKSITRMTAALLAIRTPTVAAINGHAIGGGLVLALVCDYRMATGDPAAKFALGEARAGVPFPEGPALIIRHEMPCALLRQLTLSSRSVSAQTLFDASVFDELMPTGKLGSAALERALALNAQPAFAAVKEQVRGQLARQVRERADAQVEPLFERFPS